MFRGVAALALQARVAALQWIPRLAMVELIQADLPEDRDEILAIVLGVALDAGVVAGFLRHQHGMQSLLSGQAPGDFDMTPGALKLASTRSAHVATRAMSGAVKRLMSFRKCPRRKLSEKR